MAAPLIIALGGARSGKSRFGLATATRLAAGGPVCFLATALPGDPEMDDRIARHRRERPVGWTTVEVGRDLAAVLGTVEPGATVLVDGLTLWLSAILGDDTTSVDIDPLLDGPVAAALAAIEARGGPVVIVSDEVGGGIVPMHPTARAFRDLAGIVHQQLADRADEVHLLVAGIPVRVR